MDADLIINILVGPDKFSPAKIKEAKEFARQVVAAAKLAEKRLEREPDFDISKEDMQHSLLRFMFDHEQMGFSDAKDLTYLSSLASIKPAQFVNEFISWWRSCSGRDTCGRGLPRRFAKDWKIVVCGDVSYGDSPDGYGYSTVRTAEWLNVINILGII